MKNAERHGGSARHVRFTRSPASVDPDVALVGPAQLLQCPDKCYEARLPCGIVCGQSLENTDPPLPIMLLRTEDNVSWRIKEPSGSGQC
jgi:hypothetical protein